MIGRWRPTSGSTAVLPTRCAVALVVGVHRDRGVGQHRLRAHGGDHDLAVAVRERVGDVEERVGDLAVLDLEVGDRRARPRVPVDQVVVAVDQALVVEVDEDLHDRAHVALVEREALVVVVHRGAQALELLDDRAAVLLAPLPHALDERLAPELLAARALGLEQRARPASGSRCRRGRCRGSTSRGCPRMRLVADQRVLDRAVERVAHVQHAGDVRRRDRDRVVLVRRALGLGVVQARRQPALDDPRLDLGGLEAGAVLQAGHRARESTQRISARRRRSRRATGARLRPSVGRSSLAASRRTSRRSAGGQVARPRARLAQQRGRGARARPGVSLSQCSRATTRASKQDGPFDRAKCGRARHRTEASAPGAGVAAPDDGRRAEREAQAAEAHPAPEVAQLAAVGGGEVARVAVGAAHERGDPARSSGSRRSQWSRPARRTSKTISQGTRRRSMLRALPGVCCCDTHARRRGNFPAAAASLGA